MRELTRTFCLVVGIFILTLIAYEQHFYLNQSVNYTTTLIKPQDSGFFVDHVEADSNAARAGIKQNDYFKTLNGYSKEEWNKITADFDSFIRISSQIYKFNSTITLEDFDGNIKTFMVEPALMNYKIRHPSVLSVLRFIIAIFTILCGLFCSFFYYDNKNSRPLIFFLYFVAVTSFNAYTTIWDSVEYTLLTTTLFDFFGMGAVSSLQMFLLRAIKYSKKTESKLYQELLCLIPVAIIVIKYIICIFFQISPMHSILLNIAHGIIAVISISSIALFIFLNSSSHNHPLSILRYVSIGGIITLIPTGILMFRTAFFQNNYVTEIDEVISLIPFAFFGFVIAVSSIQDKNTKCNQFARIATIWTGYITIVGLILYCIPFIDLFAKSDFFLNLIMFTILLFTPAIYFIIQRPINKFLNIDSKYIRLLNENYQKNIDNLSNIDQIYKITGETITRILDCAFIFFYTKEIDSEWNITYITNPSLPEEYLNELINESVNQQQKVKFLFDNSFCVASTTDENVHSKIFIGHKNNDDKYLPGEQSVIIKLAEAFFNKQIFLSNQAVEHQLELRSKKIIQLQKHTIIEMANLIEKRNGNISYHAQRTGLYCKLLAEQAMEKGFYKNSIDNSFVYIIERAAVLHDIGKILIPEKVLLKPGKLTASEFEIVKEHTINGRDIVKNILSDEEDQEYLQMACDIAAYHHEKWNGTGYPFKLSSTEIPLAARIMAIADVFDSLVTPCTYREAWEPQAAFDLIEEDAGLHFDPALARLFVDNKIEILKILKEYKDD